MVVVLSILVLITIVVLAYLGATALEMSTSKSYAEGVRTRILADTALEVVKGQIWAATTETNSGTVTSWASQPGAMRTFRAGDTNLQNVYKLYSSSSMVVPNSGFAPAGETPTTWASQPDEFVDLNRPVVSGTVTNYPILNPAATGVAGFQANAPGGMTSATSPLPMPVQWIYALQDGTLTNASATNSYNAANPIVGRIAFWTDDDTCKLNVNTASAARDGDPVPAGATSFWDAPRGKSSAFETGLSSFQPAQREFQRYPGHPSRLSLRTVFTNMTATDLYRLAPTISTNDADIGSHGGTKFPTGPMPVKAERLYASPDEMIFNTNRVENILSANSTPSSPEVLNRLQFFLTAYNRSPDLNPLGKPKVSMWPVSSVPANRTAIDKWFALCATIKEGATERPYYLTRQESGNATADITAPGATIPRLFKYLQDQMNAVLPGTTASFQSKYGAAGRDQLVTLMLDYIRCVNLYDSSLGNSLFGSDVNMNAFTPAKPFKWGGSSAQVPVANYWGREVPVDNQPGFGQVIPLRITPAQIPSASGTFKGLGRFDSAVSEVAVQFWAMAWNDGTPVREDDTITLGGVTQMVKDFNFSGPNLMNLAALSGPQGTPGTGAPMYAAMVLVVPFNPMLGYVKYNPDYRHTLSGLSGFQITTNATSSQIFPKDPATNIVQSGVDTRAGGGMRSVFDTMYLISDHGKGTEYGAAPSLQDNPFVSVPFSIPEANPTFVFSGGSLTLAIEDSAGNTLQTFNLSFPSVTLTKPALNPINFFNKPHWSGVVGNQVTFYGKTFHGWDINLHSGRRFRSLLVNEDNHAGHPCWWNGDVMIAVEATGAATDFRWLSLQQNQGGGAPSFFREHNSYFNTAPGALVACGLRQALNGSILGHAIGDYSNGDPSFPNLPNMGSSSSGVFFGTGGAILQDPLPIISSRYASSGVSNGLGKPPDFDTGCGDFPDGAYAGKPDEGEIRDPGQGLPYFASSYYTAARLAFSTYFAPNRQIPSPGVFGSLPSRATESDGAWTTLLFCPNPAAGATASDHKGFVEPRDAHLMDLFSMPIVEPYAISEPFSTAGRVNLNYQIVPFTYITRSTHLRAAFAANRVSAIQSSSFNDNTVNLRFPIHADETLKQFQSRFDNNGLFKSPSEICSMWLYPADPANSATALVTDTAGSSSNIQDWWFSNPGTTGKLPTGDNLREQPYVALYQNLTTQSNTYTTHVFVQSLIQSPSRKLSVTGEYRGSYSLERFLDPNHPDLPDFAVATSPGAARYYQFRVNGTKQFLP